MPLYTRFKMAYRDTTFPMGTKASCSCCSKDSTVDMKTPPLDQVNKMDAMTYFAYASELLKLHPTHMTDWSIVARMRRIGIEPGKSFEGAKLILKSSNQLKKALLMHLSQCRVTWLQWVDQ